MTNFDAGEGAITINEEGYAILPGPEEFDIQTATDFVATFQETLARNDIRQVAVCLGRTSFMDAAGIAALVESRIEARTAGVEFMIKNVRHAPRRVLEITSMVEFLNVEPSQQVT
jgi:anti-anti-sigma factor